MSHISIIIDSKILPPPDSQLSTSHAEGGSEMTATVTFKPAHTMTDTQIGNQVERICRRLSKLADD